MSLLITEKDNFDVTVKYVFTKNGDICVLGEKDDEILKLPREEKEKLSEFERENHASDIPFNKRVDLLEYTEKDLRSATFTFRKPSFDDMHLLLSSFSTATTGGSVAPSDIFEFSNRKLKLLFVKGKAQDENGEIVKIDASSLGKISPILGSAMSTRMNAFLEI